MIDILIIGGGAAGLIAAIKAKQMNPGLRVAVLERLGRTGKKLMATGNGRCNLTNVSASPDRYHGDVSFMCRAMEIHPPSDVMAFFRSIGVACMEEDNGKVYPMSGQASSVLDCLRMAMFELGCEERTEHEAADVRRVGGKFTVSVKGLEPIDARRVIITTGGLTAPKLGGSASGHKLLASIGHTMIPCLPALVQLKTPVEPIRALKGLKYDGEISIAVDGKILRAERGEVLFTEYGLSGPPVLQLSRAASVALRERRRVEVNLSVLDASFDEVLDTLKARRADFPARALENYLTGYVNKRIGQTLVKHAGLSPLIRACGTLSDGELSSLARYLTRWTLPLVGTQGFEQAQVTAGGADTREFDAETMQSKLVKGLFCAGEALNVDGDCGGFNLQWAWASGLLAAESAARSLG